MGKTTIHLDRRLTSLLREEIEARSISAAQLILEAILEYYGLDLTGEVRVRHRYHERKLSKIGVPSILRRYAEERGMTVSMFVKKALVHYFRRRGKLGWSEYPDLCGVGPV